MTYTTTKSTGSLCVKLRKIHIRSGVQLARASNKKVIAMVCVLFNHHLRSNYLFLGKWPNFIDMSVSQTKHKSYC